MGILSNFMNLNRYEILARIVIILLVLPLHEFAHGWVHGNAVMTPPKLPDG